MEIEDQPLKDKLILLIEADGFLAGYIGGSIKADGAQVLGPARTVDEAKTLIGNLRQAPHAAVISVDILEAAASVLEEALAHMGIPVLLTLGTARKLPASLVSYDVVTAPFAAYQVVHHLRVALAQTS
jgi:hypothetical protein